MRKMRKLNLSKVKSKVKEINKELKNENHNEDDIIVEANEVVVKKQVQTPFVFTSFAQIELVQKNSFEVFFGKKNILNLFFTTSRIIFPFHYFW